MLLKTCRCGKLIPQSIKMCGDQVQRVQPLLPVLLQFNDVVNRVGFLKCFQFVQDIQCVVCYYDSVNS